MAKRYLALTLLLASIIFLSSCGDDDQEDTSIPSNLMVELTESTETEGLITVTATADNAELFEIDFGVEDEVTRNATGIASYQYEKTGEFEIEVKAYGTSGKFVTETTLLTVGSIGGYTTPLTYDGWTLIWNDEFDGSTLDASTWNYEIGTGNNGWGNQELQYYTANNTFVEDGLLKIVARQQSFNGSAYTSSRITTENNFSFQYGRVDIRARVPYGQGIWPALWMLGDNFRSAGWPWCGEIDVMELVGGSEEDNATVHGTVHWNQSDDFYDHAQYGGSVKLPEGIFNDQYHVFSIIWEEGSIRWLLDDEQYHVITTTGASLSEFQAPFFFIFNIAVGGLWPGSPDNTTEFPQTMAVDYVRVFQEN